MSTEIVKFFQDLSLLFCGAGIVHFDGMPQAVPGMKKPPYIEKPPPACFTVGGHGLIMCMLCARCASSWRGSPGRAGGGYPPPGRGRVMGLIAEKNKKEKIQDSS